VGTCDQYPQDDVGQTPDPQEDPEETKLRQTNCPEEYWNAETLTCDYPEPECGDNEYFDRRLGYCIPLQDDCCEIGQDYSALYKECLPVVTKPRQGECPSGFELIDGLCWLIGRTEGQGGRCWTITRNTPRCVGPCEVGLVYNALTGRCDEPKDPCADVKCSSYTSRNSCPSNCCRWDEFATGQGTCKTK
ncbi:MAG: hypothetical protein J7L66_06380, partial [Anaerolineaceae bacterium]|nr:hypothetical protein [Anaerolineaceae bacterium]